MDTIKIFKSILFKICIKNIKSDIKKEMKNYEKKINFNRGRGIC